MEQERRPFLVAKGLQGAAMIDGSPAVGGSMAHQVIPNTYHTAGGLRYLPTLVMYLWTSEGSH